MPKKAPVSTTPHELYFLGAGGGRVVVDLQLLPTGGWRYHSPDFNLHVDPGPGALYLSAKHKLNNRKLDGVFVSHNHLDHVNDANALIEAMAFVPGVLNDEFKAPKKGALVCSPSVLQDVTAPTGHRFQQSVHDYFLNMLERVAPLTAGQSIEWKEKKAKLTAVRADHEDPTAIGFVLEHAGIKLGYTADTQMFEGISKQFEGCTHLVANALRPDGDRVPYHLCMDDLVELVNGMKRKPKTILLSHRGQKVIRAGPAAQARKVQQATGVQTRVADEGLRVDLSETPLSAFG